MVKDLELQTVNVWTHPALSLTSCVTSGFNFLSLGFPHLYNGANDDSYRKGSYEDETR